MSRHFSISLFVFAVLSAPVFPVCGEELPSPEAIAAHFVDVSLGWSDAARIVKWDRAPTIRLEAFEAVYEEGEQEPTPVRTQPSRQFRSALKEVTDELSQLTGLYMRVRPSGLNEGGDIVVSVMPARLMARLTFPSVSQSKLRRLRGPGRCFFLIWPNQKNQITKVQIIINSQIGAEGIKHCFYEEIAQSLGLPHDSQRIGRSLFNDAHRLATIPLIDRLLLQILYDPAVRPGMDRATVFPVASEIATRLLARHRSERAP